MKWRNKETKTGLDRASTEIARRLPSKISPKRSSKTVKRPRSKPKTTWVSLVSNVLAAINITLTAYSLEETVQLDNNRGMP